MKKLTALAAVLVASGLFIAACSKSQQTTSSTSATSEATAMATSIATGSSGTMATASKLPIPPSKMPTLKVAAGSASAGSSVFAANCESCHGAKGVGGGIGPRLVASGLTAGQVAYMVRNPQGVNTESAMPKLTLTDKQVADVSAYVASLK